MDPPPLRIIIAGGGICGLSCAIALRRSGHNITVLERSGFLNEVGAAITLPPNATRVLKSWGMDFEKARMVRFERAEFSDSAAMSMVASSDFSVFEKAFGAPYLLAHRVDLHEALRRMAVETDGPGKPAEILTGKQITGFEAEDGGVQLADGSVLKADLVVAADGVHSVASSFVGDLRRAVASDTTVVRFMVSTPDLLADPATNALISGDGICSVYTNAPRDRWLLRYPCRK